MHLVDLARGVVAAANLDGHVGRRHQHRRVIDFRRHPRHGKFAIGDGAHREIGVRR
jgi:hypothetical protein